MQNLSSRAVSILLPLSLVIGAADGFYAYRTIKTQEAVASQHGADISQHGADIEKLNQNLNKAKENFSDLQGQMTFTKDRLGVTQVELRKAQQGSAKVARQQQVAVTQLDGQLGALKQQQTETLGTVGTLSTDVAGVKTDLGSAKEQISSTRTDLQRVVGDLGVQSGLIARNGSELDELRRLGERDYYEFTLGKTKRPERVGNIAINLKKADAKRQRFTLNLIADDHAIEKKDKTLNEPVQFYMDGYRQPTEIVVNQINKDRIQGYLSVPKKKEGRSSLSEAAPDNSKPRS
jgi:chromosome segregation ATPase